MHKTTLYLPPELERRLAAEAARSGRTRADVVREALSEHLPPVPERPRFIGAATGPVAPAGDSANVKQWLRGEIAKRAARRIGGADQR